MELIRAGSAGTLESGDILIEIEKSSAPGVSIELSSTVANLYGRQIKQVITETLKGFGASGVLVRATDKGALDCTVRARVSVALHRACGQDQYVWGE